MSSYEVNQLIKPGKIGTFKINPKFQRRSIHGSHIVKIQRFGFIAWKLSEFSGLIPYETKQVQYVVTSQERASLLVDLLFIHNTFDRVNYDATMDEQFEKDVAAYADEDSDNQLTIGNKILVLLCKRHVNKS